MTKGHERSTWLIFTMLLLIHVPITSATGGGLLLVGDSFTVTGDQEVGSGALNISVVIHSYDADSEGFLQMTLIGDDNTPLASENRSINLLSGHFTTQQFDISGVPIGTHFLSLQLWGDVGVGFENNVSLISIFVQKLSPVNLSIESSSLWDIVPVDASISQPSGNATFRDGDYAWILAEVQNTGDLEWSGNSTLLVDNSPHTTLPAIVPGQSSSIVNFSVGPISEGIVDFSLQLSNDTYSIFSDTISVEIGPPPLPRSILSIHSNASQSGLGDSVNWTTTIENTGESVWFGVLTCDFPQDVELINQSVTLQSGELYSTNLTLMVRPGVLTCLTESQNRYHDDSVTTQTHAYDMSAGHIMRAGEDGLTLTGGPFHVGDSIPIAILIHNGGDFAGTASLEIRTSAVGESNSLGNWIRLDTRVLEVGSSLELASQYQSVASGNRLIEWRIISDDSLVSEDCSGELTLSVQPSQSLNVQFISYQWSLSGGLNVDLTTTLSSGESRDILLEIGTTGSTGDMILISTEIHLSPGQRTLDYNLGNPSTSSVWVHLTPIFWSSSTLAEDELQLIQPNPQLAVSIDSVNPDTPTPGQSATVFFTLSNNGGGSTLAGNLMLIDIKHDGEVLWVGSVPAVESDSTYSGSIELQNWPDDFAVDLSLIWHTSDVETIATGSYLSESQESGDSGYTVDWVAIVYGSLAGLLIGLITRTVMRSRAGMPLLSRRERGERIAKPKKAVAKDVEEKVEVACPSCDQRLRVPSTYSGNAKCPACAQTFPVEADTENEDIGEDVDDEQSPNTEVRVESDDKEKFSSSSDDVITCPDCEQKLKVPYQRRPVRARCPSCKCEFRALQG